MASQQVDLYSMLSGLGDTITENRKRNRERDLREAFQNGLPTAADGSVDFNRIGSILGANGGNVSDLLTVAKLGEDQRKTRGELEASAGFRSALTNMFGGGSKPAPSAPAAMPPVTAPSATPRSAVMPTSKVWGDREAEDAGLYEKPTKLVSYGGELSGQRPPPRSDAPKTGYQSYGDGVLNKSPPETAPLPQQSGFSGINITHAPALMQAMSNPRLPAGDRAIAEKLFTRALDDAKEPDRIRFLQSLKAQSGYQGTILDLERELRKNSASSVNIDQRGETEEAKAAGKAAGERRASMFSASQNASSGLASLTRIETLLDQVQQGKLEPGRMTVSAWAKSLGVNDDFAKGLGLDPKKVGDAQAVQSLVNELVIGKLGPGGFPSNNFSNTDREFLTDIFPKLGNDPRANKILIQAARRIHQDNVQRALDYQTWKEDPANKGRGFEDFELSRSHRAMQMDRFGDLRKQAEALLGTGGGGQATQGQANGIGWRVK